MSTEKKKSKVVLIKACRLCLDFEHEDNLLIDGNDGWFELLEYCIGLKIEIQDKPEMICTKCANSLWNFVEFKKKCLKSHSIWESMTSDNMICLIKKSLDDTDNKNDITKINNISLFQNVLNEIDTRKEEKCISYMKDEGKNMFCIKSKNTICIDANEKIYENNMLINENLNDSLSDIYVKEETKEIMKLSYNKKKMKIKHESNICNIKKKLDDEFVCESCNKIFEKKGWLNRHVKICSKKSKEENQKIEIQQKYLCGLCRFTSSSVDDVNKHFIEHMQRNDLECKMCDFVGIDFAQMFAHRLSHNSSGFTVKVSCPHCKESPKTQYSMEFHYRSVHLNKTGGLCSACNLEFAEYVKFRYHMLTHSDVKYVCDICNINFLFRKNIIRHLKNHRDQKKFICHECGKRFQRSNYLATHMSTVHFKGDPIKCTHCDKYFKNASTLNHHMRMYLEKKSSLKCETCGKCYAKPYELKSHQFWHTGERPHCCEICGSRYKAKGQLKVHMQKHTGLRPFKCDACTKCFPSARELRRHSRVHTGVRPYKCLHCDRNFNIKKQVLKHCAVVHKLVDALDKDCFCYINN